MEVRSSLNSTPSGAPSPGRSVLAACLVLLGVVMLAAAYWGRQNDEFEPARVAEPQSIQTSTPVATSPPRPQVIKRSSGAERRDGLETIVDQLLAKFDPAEDEWDTETLSKAAAQQLKVLGKLIEHPETINEEHVAALIADRFSCSALRPQPLDEIFCDDHTSVRRWQSKSPSNASPPPPDAPLPPASPVSPDYHGEHGLVDALTQLTKGLGERGDIRTSFKLFRVEMSEQSFTTRSLFEASRITNESGVQQNATWTCEWTYPGGRGLPGHPGTGTLPGSPGAGVPGVMRIEVEDYEEIEVHARYGKLFADCTQSAMGQNDSYTQQVLPGINHWLTRISTISGMAFFGYHGVTVGDVNGDGLDDLYVCDSGGLPNRLYIQNVDGTVTDVSEQSGVDWLTQSTASLLIDLDSDGDQDLAVSTNPLLIVAENDGHGQFTPRVGLYTGSEPRSLCAADYDEDGDLDLYVCLYSPSSTAHVLAIPLPYQDANNGGANTLWRNEGDFQFVNATVETGLNANNTRFSLAAAWEDYDNDGDVDLYVANDYGRNNLYRNDGGRFTDVAPEAQVEDIASGMSVTWGDYNRDGWMDVYVSNMFSAAGNRVAFQRRFADSQGSGIASAPMVAQAQRMSRGNTLFANTGEATFQDVSEASAVTMGRWAWASKFADVNNDGWDDLIVANGFVTADDSDDL